LRKAAIEYAGDLIQKSEDDLLNLENFGKRSLFEIRERLLEMGLGLGLEIDQEVFNAEKAKRSERLASQ
jgi:DNA-directed RNA polymerase subunit alpha